MEELTKIAKLLGEDNEKRLKDKITDLLIQRVDEDLNDMCTYLIDFEETFELDENVTDLIKYEEERKEFLKEVIEWTNSNKIGIIFGTSDDNYYLCQFDIVANTLAMCKGYVAELKSKLKTQFPKIKLVYQTNGEVM